MTRFATTTHVCLLALMTLWRIAHSQDELTETGAFENKSQIGGGCKIVVSDKCCTRERVMKKIQRVQCICTDGYVAGTTRAVPSCVKASIIESKKWCKMKPCLEDEVCEEVRDLQEGVTGWQCRKGNQIKTTKVTE